MRVKRFNTIMVVVLVLGIISGVGVINTIISERATTRLQDQRTINSFIRPVISTDSPAAAEGIRKSSSSSTRQSLHKKPFSDKEIKARMSKINMPFIANKGQIDKEVKYYAKTFGGTMFVTEKGEIVYSLPKYERKELIPRYAELDSASPETLKQSVKQVQNMVRGDTKLVGGGVALKEEFIGARIHDINGEEKSETKVSYFRGNDPAKWQSSIETFNEVSLGEVYEGIRLSLKAYGNNVEKLFYVKPGANPEDIKVSINGANEIKVNENGELEVETELGAIRFTKPIAYQEINGKRVNVEVAYLVNSTCNVIPACQESFFSVRIADKPQ